MTAVCGCIDPPTCSGRPVTQLEPNRIQSGRSVPARSKLSKQHRRRLSGSGLSCRSTRQDFKPEDQTMYKPLRHRPYNDQHMPDDWLPETDDWMTVTNKSYRNGKPFEETVSAELLDAIFDETLEESIVPADMQFWFTKPPGGWSTGHRRVQKAKIIPGGDENAEHFGTGRTSTLDLVPGQEFTGTIRKIMLHHGALVDIGAQHDALLPCTHFNDWTPDAIRTCEIFSDVRIRIHRIVHSPICRFPLIAELAQPELRVMLPGAADYSPSFDLRGGWAYDQLRVLTGRDMRIMTQLDEEQKDGLMKRQFWNPRETDAEMDKRYSAESFETSELKDRVADMATQIYHSARQQYG